MDIFVNIVWLLWIAALVVPLVAELRDYFGPFQNLSSSKKSTKYFRNRTKPTGLYVPAFKFSSFAMMRKMENTILHLGPVHVLTR